MDRELLQYLEDRWGQYEAALAAKDAQFLHKHQNLMALVRTMASVMALGVSIFVAYKVW